MKTVLLKDICKPKQWKTIPVSKLKDKGYPVYGANGIIGYWHEYNHEKPTILVTCRGATCGEINVSSPKSYITGNAMCLDGLDKNYSLDFIEAFLRAYDFGKVISGTAQPQITKSGIGQIPIPILSLSEQKILTERFRRILKLISLGKNALKIYDDLVKSRFVEMFGTASDKRCVFLPTEEVCEVVVDCPHETPKYQGDLKYPAIRTSELVGTTICWDTMKYVSEDEYQKRTRRLKPRPGDVVYAREGTYGNAAVLPKGKSFCLGQRIMLFRVDSTVCLPEFFLYALTSTDVRKQADELNVGTTVPHVNVRDAKKFLIPIPPLSLQREFADFVTQVDKLKFDFDFLVSFSIPSICLFCLKLDP